MNDCALKNGNLKKYPLISFATLSNWDASKPMGLLDRAKGNRIGHPVNRGNREMKVSELRGGR
jgi:hypothetical protein